MIKTAQKGIRPLSSVLVSVLFALILNLVGSTSYAQWRIVTPRDTVIVPANQAAVTTAPNFRLNAGGVDMWVSPSLSFTENDGTTTFGIDGAYTYLINGSPLIPEAANPPTYAGKAHQYRLHITTIPGLGGQDFVPLENSYQANHIYTQHIASQGNKPQFNIISDKPADYAKATGSLAIRLARWTAGIAVENFNLDFGSVLVGTSKQILDSIESYGVDDLQIDSIRIIDPSGSGDFTFLSERNNRFTLFSEKTNEFKVTFSPSAGGTTISAELRIYSHNADPISRITVIKLYGTGIAPNFGVGPPQIDFGKVRIGYPKLGFTQISNVGGTAELVVNANTVYQQYQPTPPPVAFSTQTAIPLKVTPGSIGQIRTIFNPTQQSKYQGVLRVRADNVPFDSVILTGEGAQPIPVLTPAKNTALDFGVVYNGTTIAKTVTLQNKGNWTASVILARISGQFKSMFTFTPIDTEFNVEPDSSRLFNVFFHPGAPSDSLHVLCYFEIVYDDNSIDSILLTGVEIQPEVLISPVSHDFGPVKIGAWKIDTVSYVRTSLKASSSVRLIEDVRPGAYFSEVGKIGSINPNETIPFVCKFKPLQPGPTTAWAFVTANGKLDSVRLTGIGAVAKAIFNPTPVNYGIVPSNKPDTLITVLKDSGDYSLQVDSIVITGPAASDFQILWKSKGGRTPDPTFTIDPDSSIDIQVRFVTNALTGAVHEASLCVYYSDGSSDCIPIQAIEEAQFLQFAQSSVDFGKQRIKTHSAPTFGVFRNGSNKVLSVGAVTTTSNTAPDPFSVLDTLRPVSPQSRDSVPVDFYPQTRGFFTGYLHAFGGDIKTDSIRLSGQGAAPLPEFSDSVVDFGIVALGTPKTLTFELLDTGDWFLKAVKIEKISDKYSEFQYAKGSQVSITSDSIGEQQYSTYQVTFTPTKTVVFHSAKLVFTFDDGTQGIVRLIGYDESPTVVFDLDSMDFGKVRIGTPAQSNSVNIVSTSSKTLTVQNLDLLTAAPGSIFVSLPSSGPITMPSQTLYPVKITFTPTAIGTFTATLRASGKDVRDDSVFMYITGIGAAPIAALSSQTLDFGTLFPGYTASRSLTIRDSGNWLLSVVKVEVVGTNKADFTLRNIPSQFDILEDSASSYIVDFLGTTPYQSTPRTAQIIFTLDDGSTFSVNLTELDIEPIKVDIRMDNERVRLGDIAYPCLRLKTDLPDSLHILDLKGVITYDATLFDLDRTGVRSGDMVIKLGNWTLIQNNADLPGMFTYELQGTAAPLSKAGSLLRLKFKPHANDPLGASSPLQHTQFSFPLRTELNPLVTDAVMVIDSNCGTIQLESTAIANMVDQNMPNPFGTKTGNNETQIPFDIGFDNTPVTIRILDVSGHEVVRLVDNVIFSQGRYTTKVDASLLKSTGMYFYEFRAGDSKPVYKKMMVSK